MKICQYSESPDQLFMWSEAALAADMAELSFLAAITAAPRFWMVGTKTVFTQSLSRLAGAPGQGNQNLISSCGGHIGNLANIRTHSDIGSDRI